MPASFIKKFLIVFVTFIVIGCVFSLFFGKGYASPTDEKAINAIKKELETKEITVFASTVQDEFSFLGFSYENGKLGLAVFEKKDERFHLKKVFKQEKMLNRALDTYLARYSYGAEYLIFMSSNEKLAEIVFSGDFEGTIPVFDHPSMTVQKLDIPDNYLISYEFFDAEGNELN